ncbi:TPA: fimbrial protein [Escherichia coli]|nr:fimbrial protein [Escherichia coli]
MKTKLILRTMLLLVGSSTLFIIKPVSAIDVDIKITGEIYIPPCQINNGADVNVSFGKISLQKVDGNEYAVTKTVNVNCEYYRGEPYIQLSGGSVLPGAPDNVLKTTSGPNVSSLGIALYQGGGVNASYPMNIGQGVNGKGFKIIRGLSSINSQNGQFTFTAVPYKKGNDELVAGTFGATMTMSISYV